MSMSDGKRGKEEGKGRYPEIAGELEPGDFIQVSTKACGHGWRWVLAVGIIVKNRNVWRTLERLDEESQRQSPRAEKKCCGPVSHHHKTVWSET